MTQTHSLDLESGSSQYASIADASQVGLDLAGDFTIEAWWKPENITSDSFIINKGDFTGATIQYMLFWAGSDGLYLRVSDDGTNAGTHAITWKTTGGINVGEWQHIAVTFSISGETATCYINGQSVTFTKTAGTTIGASLYNGAAAVRVGARDNGGVGSYLDGLLKDLRVFSDIRTQAEIIADARTQNVVDANLKAEWNFNNAYTDSSGNGNTLTAVNTPVFSTDIPWEGAADIDGSTYLETSLVSYWPLNETSGTRNDAHSTNHLSQVDTVASAAGKLGNGADFESGGADECLEILDAAQSGLDLANDIGISLWVKFESLPGSNAIMSMLNKTSGATVQYQLAMYNVAGAMRLYFFMENDSASAEFVSWTPSTGVWYHIVLSRNRAGGLVKFFVDGAQLGATQTAVTTVLTNRTVPFRLGGGEGTGGQGGQMDGILDEVALYSRILHYGDVLDLFNAGVGIPYVASAPAQNSAFLALIGA